jgi:hypothetical protein
MKSNNYCFGERKFTRQVDIEMLYDLAPYLRSELTKQHIALNTLLSTTMHTSRICRDILLA